MFESEPLGGLVDGNQLLIQSQGVCFDILGM